jgi:hypothetical protein
MNLKFYKSFTEKNKNNKETVFNIIIFNLLPYKILLKTLS